MESPCINVCVLDPATGLCQGCGRTRAEITGWTRFTDDERRRIMMRLAPECGREKVAIEVAARRRRGGAEG